MWAKIINNYISYLIDNTKIQSTDEERYFGTCGKLVA